MQLIRADIHDLGSWNLTREIPVRQQSCKDFPLKHMLQFFGSQTATIDSGRLDFAIEMFAGFRGRLGRNAKSATCICCQKRNLRFADGPTFVLVVRIQHRLAEGCSFCVGIITQPNTAPLSGSQRGWQVEFPQAIAVAKLSKQLPVLVKTQRPTPLPILVRQHRLASLP